MNIDKCSTCEHFGDFFNICGLYLTRVYMGESEFEYQPVYIKDVKKSECKYKVKGISITLCR